MSAATLWWIAAGAAVATELMTGTFYLLMLALGLVAGALAAHLGWELTAQLVSAAVIGGLAVGALHLRRRHQPRAPQATANKDVNLDIGEQVHVDAWATDGQARARYRGAEWQIQLAAGCAAVTGPQRIVEVAGNRLIVQPLHSA